jgi:amino acid transporter
MKEHKISLMTAILLNMNIMIGSGILIGPALIAAKSGAASFLAWPLTALIFLPMVLCTAQLGRMFPTGGGFYVYAREGLNQTAGYMSGLLYTIGYTITVGAEVLAFRRTLLGVMEPNWFLNNAFLFNLVAVAVFMALNLMSFKFFSRLLNSLTIAKILPMLIMILVLPFVINWDFTITTPELYALPSSFTFAIFGFFGFEYCSSLAHLIEDSERNAPRAALFGFLATAALYTLFHFGVLNLMGSEQLAALGAPAFAQFLPASLAFLKVILIFLIPLASVLIIFAAGNGIMNANLMMMESMAKEGLFWKSSWVTKLNGNGRPWIAALIQAVVIMVIITLLPDISHVGNLCNLGILFGYLLPFVSLLVLQRRRGETRMLPVSVAAIVATLGLLAYSFCQLGVTWGDRLWKFMPIVILVAIGFVVYMMRPTKRPLHMPEPEDLTPAAH